MVHNVIFLGVLAGTPVLLGVLHWVSWRLKVFATRDRVLHDRLIWMALSVSVFAGWYMVFHRQLPYLTPGIEIIQTAAHPVASAIFHTNVAAFFVNVLLLFPYHVFSGWWKSVDYAYRASFVAKKLCIPAVVLYVLVYHGPNMQPSIYIRLLVFMLRYLLLDAATDAVSAFEASIRVNGNPGWRRLTVRIVLRLAVLVPCVMWYFTFENVEMYRQMFGNMFLSTSICGIVYGSALFSYLNPLWFWSDAVLYKLF